MLSALSSVTNSAGAPGLMRSSKGIRALLIDDSSLVVVGVSRTPTKRKVHTFLIVMLAKIGRGLMLAAAVSIGPYRIGEN